MSPLPIHMPRLVGKDKFSIQYKVPSKTRAHLEYALVIMKTVHRCECPAKDWGHPICRHYKFVTIKGPRSTNLKMALEALEDRENKPYAAWGFIGCTMPEHYAENSISCPDCMMYPDLCNVRMIKYKRNAKPMVWRIQSAMIAGKRKEALRLLRLYIKLVAAARKVPL